MSLDKFRQEIDAIDEQVVSLLHQRADIAKRVGAHKAETNAPVYDPARESKLLRAIVERGSGPMPDDSLRAIYREIISSCRALQTLVVAYLGPALTNTYLAALKHFGPRVTLEPCRSVMHIFDAVERGDAQIGVVPIENSLNGVVGETYDCLLDTSLKVCAETYLPIHHALLSREDITGIKTLFSHPQVFAQSREWLGENLPGVDQIATSSTASAAQKAADEPGAAAIAPMIAAEPHGLKVLADHIEDRPDNRTRFFILSRHDAVPTGNDKTSIVFSVAHRAGSLHDALQPFHRHGINLTLIQSRPARGRLWEYVFFVDIVGHVTDAQLRGALGDLESQCPHVKVLGSYPAAE